jgi:hypothetical protein
VGRGKPLGGNAANAAQVLIGGWKFGGIATFQSGRYLTPTDAVKNSNAGGSRPDVIGDPDLQSYSNKPAMLDRFFDTSAFARAPQFTFGNSGTGILQGPGLQIFDLSLYKDFRVAESRRIQLRAEMFNAFNHANFDNPGTVFGTPSFGIIRSTATPAREIQLGLRFDF